MQCIWFDYKNEVMSWYARVPTGFNIADGPSRIDSKEVIRLTGATRVKPLCPKEVNFANVLM